MNPAPASGPFTPVLLVTADNNLVDGSNPHYINATALPLPTGAAQETAGNLDQVLSELRTQSFLSSLNLNKQAAIALDGFHPVELPFLLGA